MAANIPSWLLPLFAPPRAGRPGVGISQQAFTPGIAPNPSGPTGPVASKPGPGLADTTMPTSQGGAAPPGQGTKPEDWLAKLMAFFDEMNKPLDMNDPYVKNILDNARQSTLSSINSQGVYGGYSQGQAEKSYINSAAQLQQQRQQMGLSALGMGGNQSLGLADFRYGQGRDAYQDQLNQWKYQRDQGGGLGGMIGGGLGAIAGGLLGGPGGAMAGWQGGQGIGSWLGGNASPPPPTYKGYV